MTRIYTISYKGSIEIEANSENQAMDKLLDIFGRDNNVTYMNIEDASDPF